MIRPALVSPSCPEVHFQVILEWIACSTWARKILPFLFYREILFYGIFPPLLLALEKAETEGSLQGVQPFGQRCQHGVEFIEECDRPEQ